MKMVTPKQIAKTINLVADSGIESSQYQRLLQSGRFTALLHEFVSEEEAHPEPTITPIKVPLDYARTLVQMRDAWKYNGYVNADLNDENFPVEAGQSGEREFVLVCFNRPIDDDEDPSKSELLKELDKLGLVPEGPMELCFVGTDERTRDLQRKFPIVARRQVWRGPDGYLRCPILDGSVDGRDLDLSLVRHRWLDDYRFLASRK